MNLELNQQFEECLIKKQNITHTLVTNVCTGEQYEVPHGSLDAIVFGAVITLIIMVIGMIGYMVLDLKRY